MPYSTRDFPDHEKPTDEIIESIEAISGDALPRGHSRTIATEWRDASGHFLGSRISHLDVQGSETLVQRNYANRRVTVLRAPSEHGEARIGTIIDRDQRFVAVPIAGTGNWMLAENVIFEDSQAPFSLEDLPGSGRRVLTGGELAARLASYVPLSSPSKRGTYQHQFRREQAGLWALSREIADLVQQWRGDGTPIASTDFERLSPLVQSISARLERLDDLQLPFPVADLENELRTVRALHEVLSRARVRIERARPEASPFPVSGFSRAALATMLRGIPEEIARGVDPEVAAYVDRLLEQRRPPQRPERAVNE